MARFSETNPQTGKTWKLQELYDALTEAREEIHYLRAVEAAKEVEVIPLKDYIKDFKTRYDTHDREFVAAVKEALQGWQMAYKAVKSISLPEFL